MRGWLRLRSRTLLPRSYVGIQSRDFLRHGLLERRSLLGLRKFHHVRWLTKINTMVLLRWVARSSGKRSAHLGTHPSWKEVMGRIWSVLPNRCGLPPSRLGLDLHSNHLERNWRWIQLRKWRVLPQLAWTHLPRTWLSLTERQFRKLIDLILHWGCVWDRAG